MNYINCKHKPLALMIFLSCNAVYAQTNENNSPKTADEPTSAVQLEEVIVTGEKIDKALFDTNSSVEVFQFSDNGKNRDVYQLADTMSNVIAPPSGLPHIRGIDGRGPTSGFLTYQTGARSRVATMVDGVAESWSGVNFGKAGMWDVEQVEIFRGPQSTMQGRNAISGATVVNTKNPTYHWEGALRLGYENKDDKYHAAAMLSGPIVDDELAFRVAIDGLTGNSPIEYKKPGGKDYPWDPSQAKDRNIRAKLLWEPAAVPGLKTTLTVVDRDAEGEYTNLVTQPYFDYVWNDDMRGTRHQKTDSQTYQLKTEYEFNDSLNAEVLLSRRNYHTGFEGFPFTDWVLDLDETSNAFDAKMNYHPSDSKVKVAAGIHLYDRDQVQVLEGFKTNGDTKSRALYFNSDTQITDTVSLQAGGRLQKDSQNRHFRGRLDEDFVIDTEKTVFLPAIGLTYAPQENLRFGATLKKGYNPGGASLRGSNKSPYQFDEESVWTGELSVRSKLADDRVNLSANIFYSEYDNYQSMLSIPPAAGSNQPWNDTVILNIPKARTYGLEASADITLDTWKLGANLGLLSSRVKTAPDDRPKLKSNKFTYAPAVSAGLSVEKFFDNGLSVGGNLRYVGSYYDSIDNDGPKAGGYTQLDLNATYEFDNDLTLRAYINNVTNAEYVYRHKGKGDYAVAEVGSPRTFGLTVDYKF